jgi:hypothetical protein
MNSSEEFRALAARHLEAAHAGTARCMAHGHRFQNTDREPVVVQTTDGNHVELFCRRCASAYGKTIYSEKLSEDCTQSNDSLPEGREE